MRWLMTEGTQKNLVYIDEFCINVWTARTKGRAPVGQPAVRITSGQRGQNLMFCLAISPQFGFVHYRCTVDGFNHLEFALMLGELQQLLADENVIFVVDNARPHANPPAMLERHELRYLPQYSHFYLATRHF